MPPLPGWGALPLRSPGLATARLPSVTPAGVREVDATAAGAVAATAAIPGSGDRAATVCHPCRGREGQF